MKYWLCLKISASALRALGAPEGFRSPVQVAVWLFGCVRVDFCSGVSWVAGSMKPEVW